jgi:hypothetical protein
MTLCGVGCVCEDDQLKKEKLKFIPEVRGHNAISER